MNQPVYIWNGILSLLVVILFYMVLSAPKSDSMPTFQPKKVTSDASSRIVYVNSDSLSANYKFFTDKKKELENKKLAFEAEMEKKLKAFENEYRDAETKAATMSQMEVQMLQQKFASKEQDLMKYKDAMTKSLIKEEDDSFKKLFDNISNYLTTQKEKLNFDYVLSYTKGGYIFYANDSLDITNDVIKGLNDEYAKK